MKNTISQAEKLERARLKKIYSCSGESDFRWGLIKEAARLHILLDKCYADISENGMTECFQQSPNVPSYERERPVVKQYQTFNKQYQTIMKQLNDSLRGETESIPPLSLD